MVGNAHPMSATLSAVSNATMPIAAVEVTAPLNDLERRHDDALRQLEELDQKIERALGEFSAVQKETAERFGRTQKAAA